MDTRCIKSIKERCDNNCQKKPERGVSGEACDMKNFLQARDMSKI